MCFSSASLTNYYLFSLDGGLGRQARLTRNTFNGIPHLAGESRCGILVSEGRQAWRAKYMTARTVLHATCHTPKEGCFGYPKGG